MRLNFQIVAKRSVFQCDHNVEWSHFLDCELVLIDEKKEEHSYQVGRHLTPCDLLFVCLVGFLTSSSTARLYRGRAPRQSVWQFYVLPHMRQSWETMTSVSAGHIILTPTQPVESGRLQRESNPEPPHQKSHVLPTELPPPPPPYVISGTDLRCCCI